MNLKSNHKRGIWFTKRFFIIIEIVFIGGLFSYGLIRQNRSSQISDLAQSIKQCKEVSQPKECYAAEIRKALEEGKVEEAFTSLAGWYDTGELSGETCHDLTHQIGQGAYQLFVQGKPFTVSPKTAYCSYGFYHGFMEALVTRGGDMKKARDFCELVDSQLFRQTPDVTLQCYHGIGHGTVNSHDPRNWGNEQALIEPALKLCEQVSNTKERLSRCATGVFNGVATFYGTGEYKLVANQADPLWICRAQKEEYKDACYISLNITLLSVAKRDFRQAARFVEAIPEDTYAKHAMINLAGPIGTQNAGKNDHSDSISVCRSLQSRLIDACLQGYAFGFMEHGTPEQEYVKAFEFCNNKILVKSEQTACFEYIFSYLRQWYSQEKARVICGKVEDEFRPLCFKKIALEILR